MNKAFTLWLWENDPSVNTPLSEENLNKLNRAVDTIDSRVVSMDTTKANKADLLTALADVSYNESTGVITFTKKNGATIKIDTKLEKLAINFAYDKTNQRLVITLDDGTIQYVDMKALITELEFLNSDTVLFSVTNGKVSANIAKGSITDEMLESGFLANVQLYVSQAVSASESASKFAIKSESYAVGGTGTRAGEDKDNAKYYASQAKTLVSDSNTVLEEANKTLEEVSKRVTGTTFNVNLETGNLEFESPNYNFFLNESNGNLEWEVK